MINIKDLQNKLEEKKKELKAFQSKELERLNKEFLQYDYARRFNVDQETVIAAIIGRDYASNEYIKKQREQKVKIMII